MRHKRKRMEQAREGSVRGVRRGERGEGEGVRATRQDASVGVQFL